MKRSKTPVTVTGDTENWVDDAARQMVDSSGRILVFKHVLQASAYPFEVTFPVASHLLNFPERRSFSEAVSAVTTKEQNFVDASGRQMVDSSGRTLIFNTAAATSAQPIVLTFPPQDGNLTIE